jgi:hypothetical protein
MDKLRSYVGKWVIVHYEQYSMQREEVGKLSDIGNSIVLDTFSGSFEKGCLPSASTIPLSDIIRVYNIKCEVIYENK